MGKKSRLKRERKMAPRFGFWEDAEGIHSLLPFPGKLPENASEKLTENFQENLKGSPIWNKMVEEFGEEKAEQLLKECKAQVKN